MLKWLTSHFFLGFLMLASLLVLHRTDLPWIESLRHHTFDFYQQLHPREPNPQAQAAPVYIIDIDERALAQVGQWPWPRTTLAKLVNQLARYNVAVTGFDIVFAEPDNSSPSALLRNRDDISPAAITELEKLPDNEQVFAQAIANGRVVVGQVGLFEPTAQQPINPKVGYGILSPDADNLVKPMLNGYQGLVANLPILDKAADGVGLFSTRSGYGGTIRSVALIEEINGVITPSLGLEMLRVALGGRDDYLIRGFKDGNKGIESIVVKGATPQMKFEIPTDEHGRVYVHFAQYPTAKPPLYISAAEVLYPKDEAALREKLQGALVIIGTSAVGLKDIRKTPINPVLPGVEVHAQLLENILSNNHLTRSFEVIIIEWLLILMGGMAMIIIIPRVSAFGTFLLTTLAVSSVISAGWYFYSQKNQLFDASYPALSLFALFMMLGYLNYAREEKQRKQVRNAFSHYVSPDLLEDLANNPDKLVLGGETRNLTVFFSDIRGFTKISEQFNAQELTRFINSFLTPMTNVILKRKGTIDKYMGDAIMAFWNAPLTLKDHAAQACYAALEMQQAVKDLNQRLKTQIEAENNVLIEGESPRIYIPIEVGVGLNTDDCCVGNMGSDQRFDYSALGDGVNLGSRLEGQTKTYGVDIILGQNTESIVRDRFALLELDLIQVKGKTEPVRIFALMGDEQLKDTEDFRSLKNLVDNLLMHYRAGSWDNARRLAVQLKKQHQGLQCYAQLLICRIDVYKQHPPAQPWDGVAIADSK